MRSRLSRRLRHLTASFLTASLVLLSTIGVLAGMAAGPLGTSTACGCELKPPVWNKNEKYQAGAKVEWPAGGKICYVAKEPNTGVEPPKEPPWEKVAC